MFDTLIKLRFINPSKYGVRIINSNTNSSLGKGLYKIPYLTIQYYTHTVDTRFAQLGSS